MIIDIRSSSSYSNGHFKGAINIPFSELYLHPDEYLDFHTQYSIYCNSGVKSRILVHYLKQLGYDCVNIEGGYSNHLF